MGPSAADVGALSVRWVTRNKIPEENRASYDRVLERPTAFLLGGHQKVRSQQGSNLRPYD